MFELMLTALIGQAAGPTGGLERLVEAAAALELVAVDERLDPPSGRWCKQGGPAAAAPVRVVKGPAWPTEDVGEPRRTRKLRLRESSCDSAYTFRVELTEWTYAEEADARRAAEAIAAMNHNHHLKIVHRLWREGRRLYFASAGAFMHWDRFDRVMTGLGVPRGVCQHR